jgi:hypothetical protein
MHCGLLGYQRHQRYTEVYATMPAASGAMARCELELMKYPAAAKDSPGLNEPQRDVGW